MLLGAQAMAVFFHVAAGILAGSLFGVETLVVLALVVLIESIARLFLHGITAGLLGLLIGETGLQMGYLAGIGLRSVLERVGILVMARPTRPS